MTRRARALSMLLLLAILVLPACGGDDDPTREPSPEATRDPRALEGLVAGREFLAPDGRYSLRVPPDWLKSEAAISELSFYSTAPGHGLTLNIAREQLRTITHAQAYAEAARETIEDTFRDVVTISTTPVVVADHQAIRWIYTASMSEGDYYYYQVFLVDRGEGFVFTGRAPQQVDFAATQAIFDSVVGSLRFGRG